VFMFTPADVDANVEFIWMIGMNEWILTSRRWAWLIAGRYGKSGFFHLVISDVTVESQIALSW